MEFEKSKQDGFVFLLCQFEAGFVIFDPVNCVFALSEKYSCYEGKKDQEEK